MKAPQTIPEWEEYISQLGGVALLSKARGANTQRFIDDLLTEGYRISDIEQILTLFARQFARTGQKPPNGGAYSLLELTAHDPVAATTTPMSEFEVEAMEPPEEAPDYIDQIVTEATTEPSP